jgi:hypothetical protein
MQFTPSFWFDSCAAESCGAISTKDSFLMRCVSILSCRASHSATFDFATELDLEHCLFLDNQAILFEFVYRSSVSTCNVATVNMTKSRAAESVGCMESLMHMRYSTVADPAAVWHNGSICAPMLTSIAIDKCIFAKYNHGTQGPESAPVLLVSTDPSDRLQLRPERFELNLGSCCALRTPAERVRVSVFGSRGEGDRDEECCGFNEMTFVAVTPWVIGYNSSVT